MPCYYYYLINIVYPDPAQRMARTMSLLCKNVFLRVQKRGKKRTTSEGKKMRLEISREIITPP